MSGFGKLEGDALARFRLWGLSMLNHRDQGVNLQDTSVTGHLDFYVFCEIIYLLH